MEKNNTLGIEKLESFFDAGTFVELGAFAKRKNADEYEGVITGFGAVNGKLVYAFAQDQDRMKGAFDELHAKKIERLYNLAVKGGAPVVGVFDSNGAVVYDGASVLSGYGRIMKCVSDASGVIPQIAIIDGNCSGLSSVVSSMFDFKIGVNAENKEAVDGAQNNLLAICTSSRNEAFAKAKELIGFIPSNNGEGTVIDISEDDLNRTVAVDGIKGADLIKTLADNGKYLELYGDFGTMTVGFASFGGVSSAVIGAFGIIDKKSTSKIAKLVSFADAYHMPILTLVDSEGIDKEVKCACFPEKLAKVASAYASSDTAKVSVIVGKAFGGAFTLLGSKALGADVVFALDNAEISVLSPESSVAFLWNDKITKEKTREDVENEWKTECASPVKAAAQGEVDDIIESNELRMRVCSAISMLVGKAEGEITRKHTITSL